VGGTGGGAVGVGGGTGSVGGGTGGVEGGAEGGQERRLLSGPARRERPVRAREVSLQSIARELRGQGPWLGPAYRGNYGLRVVLGRHGEPPRYVVCWIDEGTIRRVSDHPTRAAAHAAARYGACHGD